jgi:hypothetical protein
VPINFEVVTFDPKAEDNKDLENALCAIKRNGVALKGKKTLI